MGKGCAWNRRAAAFLGEPGLSGQLGEFLDRQLNPTYTVDDGHAGTALAGSYPDGASPNGASDMAENVAKWVADWYIDPYPQSEQTTTVVNPKRPATEESRVMRGGAWMSNDENNGEKLLASPIGIITFRISPSMRPVFAAQGRSK